MDLVLRVDLILRCPDRKVLSCCLADPGKVSISRFTSAPLPVSSAVYVHDSWAVFPAWPLLTLPSSDGRSFPTAFFTSDADSR